MAIELIVEAPRRVVVGELDEAPLGPDDVRIRTLFSGISAGTELTLFTGSNPYLAKSWDSEARLFAPSQHSWSFPRPAIGYEEVGEIVEIGTAVTGLEPGEIVFGTWGHRGSHVASADWARARKLPTGLPAICGIFSQIGAIALNAILDADIHIGETVAIFGQGVLGLIVTQLAKASGAEVIAIDRIPGRLEMAKTCGADHVLDGTKVDVARSVKELTGGRGADVSIEVTGAYGALHEAIRATAYNSRIVVSGFFQGEGRGLSLGEEFHHNRVQLVCSQISGVSRHLDHRWDRPRLDRTIMKLQAQGRINLEQLISHRLPAIQLQDAYELLADRPQDALQVVLDFREQAS